MDKLSEKMLSFRIEETNIESKYAVVRVDGKSFKKFAKGFKEPYDDTLLETILRTAKGIYKTIPYCIKCYVQSDEINIVIKEPKNHKWNKKRLDKIGNQVKALTTDLFNLYYSNLVERFGFYYNDSTNKTKEDEKYYQMLLSKVDKVEFDYEIFILPENEIENYIGWRKRDRERTFLQTVSKKYISQKELTNKTRKQLMEILIANEVDLNKFPNPIREGVMLDNK